MKGHIRERSPGRWAIILDVRDASTGKRKRRWHSFTGTKRQAQIECARLISEMKGGTYLDPSRLTVAEFLERWLDHIAAQVSPRTHERYAELVRQHLVPLLGAPSITKLQPAQIAQAYTKALTKGRQDGKGGLSPRTVHHLHRILNQALGQALRWQLTSRNPCEAVDPPKIERSPMSTYDLGETAELIEVMRGTGMFIPTMLGVLCGLRRGEISALRWRQVDLDAGQISVVESVERTRAGYRFKPPKSGRSRTVALPATVVEELSAHRLQQAQNMLRLGVRLGDDGFVAALPNGQMMRPDYLTHRWIKSIRASGLPVRRLHDLRHAHATHLLASGVHPKVAQERLGHSTVAITLDLYSHVLPGMQEDAAARIDAALQGARTKASKTKW